MPFLDDRDREILREINESGPLHFRGFLDLGWTSGTLSKHLKHAREENCLWVETMGKGLPTIRHLTLDGIHEAVPQWEKSPMHKKRQATHSGNWKDLGVISFETEEAQAKIDQDIKWRLDYARLLSTISNRKRSYSAKYLQRMGKKGRAWAKKNFADGVPDAESERYLQLDRELVWESTKARLLSEPHYDWLLRQWDLECPQESFESYCYRMGLPSTIPTENQALSESLDVLDLSSFS